MWWRENDPYGIHSQVFFAFSPDGRRLVTPGDQYLIDGFGELSATDGSVLFQTQSGLQARDAAWDRELVINVGETFSFAHRAVVEIATERVLLELDEPNWPTTSPATLSSDGEKLITLSCDQIERRGVTDAAIDVLPFDSTGSGCTGNTALTVSARGNAAIFAPTDDGEIRLADFSELRLSTFRGHAPASELDPGTPHPTHSVLAIALSPNEQRLATTGADRTLRIWSHPEFEQLLPDIPISWSTAFTNCYCSYRSFAPVAWSPDGALLASPDSEHNTALRRACDGQIIATLEAPASDAVFSPEPQGPAFLAFTPRGDGLAVFRMGSLAFYRIAR